MIVAATGHRPQKLGGFSTAIDRRLVNLAAAYLERVRPTRVIVGMALGWDQAVAEAALALGIPFTAAVPFEAQDLRWPECSRRRYRILRARAAETVVLETSFTGRAMQKRNEWMVDRCECLVALWDGSFGGTFDCLQYASRVGRPSENLWPKWVGDLSDLLS